MSANKKIININEAKDLLESLGEDFTVIANPDYVHPPFEIIPLAKKLKPPLHDLKAVVMDMDGTTTTTEELCIHSLEFMIRKMSGKISDSDWTGLNKSIDYPHIIGNSTTKHVEYLITTYKDLFSNTEILKSFISAVVWTVCIGKDAKRKEEAKLNLDHFGLSEILNDISLTTVTSAYYDNNLYLNKIDELINKNDIQIKLNSITDLVRVGIDIYYQRYHDILEQINKGESKKISESLFGDQDKHLIEPMPGVFIFLSLVKGWLGDEIKNIIPALIDEYKLKSHHNFDGNTDEIIKKLVELSNYFVSNPVKTAVVTSSIAYEAKIVMSEMMKVVHDKIDKYELSEKKKEYLKEKFSDYKNLYNTFVTASDSSEIRLKPHRDLYSIALHQLGISKNNFDKVIGFEDSESGTIAIRTAGIGLCIAVPFAETSGHNLEAAAYICKGGLPEALLNYNLFM